MREIKFRAWDGQLMHKAFDLTQNPLFWWKDNYDFPLMQYTGLKDTNGVEIYEGDIVKGKVSEEPSHVCQGLKQSGLVGMPVSGQIAYSATYAQFYFTTDGITYLDLCLGLRDIEVIGNIYENSDILQP